MREREKEKTINNQTWPRLFICADDFQRGVFFSTRSRRTYEEANLARVAIALH